MNNLIIRKLKKEDAKDVSRIFVAITKAKLNIDYTRFVKEQVQREEDASFVAELEGKTVGFMISNIISSGFGLLNKSAWIVMLGVDPEFMGQGIDSRLAQEIFKASRKKI